jgi:putative transposase
MDTGYQIKSSYVPHFLTFQVINWVDVFTRKRYKDMIVESLNYCIKHKALKVHAWVIMSNHIHTILSHETNLSNVIRDFKTYTSKAIVKSIVEFPESRREWMLFQFNIRGKMNSRNTNFQFWTHSNHPIELGTNEMIDQRLNYIHENPVKAGIVLESIYYNYSSAGDYADVIGLVPIVRID